MSCHEIEALLDGYVDEELTPNERLGVERHLADCPACRRAADEIRSLVARAEELPRDVPPPRDLFPEIRAQIEEREAGGVAGVESPHVRRVPWIGLAASLLVVAIASSTVIWLRDGTGSSPSVVAPAGDVLPASGPGAEPLDGVIQDYVDAADLLLVAFDERKGQLSPETRDVLEKNLAIIDQAIDEVRLLLETDPSSRGKTVLLRAMHEQKVEFLRRVSRLST